MLLSWKSFIYLTKCKAHKLIILIGPSILVHELHRASSPVPLLKITTGTRDNLNQMHSSISNKLQHQNTRNDGGLDAPIMIQDKCDRFHLTVVRFLLECEAELFRSPTSVSTPLTVLAMWPILLPG